MLAMEPADSISAMDSAAVKEEIINANHDHNVEFLKYPDNLVALRNSVEETSHHLTSAWDELHRLLKHYKAQLFSADVKINQSLNAMDVMQLKQEVLNRDSLIHEREGEISLLRTQLEQFQQHTEELQNHSEQCRLDMDTKDRLLKQYQQDLMEKETQLMAANTRLNRLESKMQVADMTHVGVATAPATPTRRARHVGAVRGGRMTQAGQGKYSPAMTRHAQGIHSLRKRTAHSQMEPHHTPRSPRLRNQVPQPQQQQVVSHQIIATEPPPQPLPHPPTDHQQVAPQSLPPQQIVCIEVDEDTASEILNKTEVQTSTQVITTTSTESMSMGAGEPEYKDPHTALISNSMAGGGGYAGPRDYDVSQGGFPVQEGGAYTEGGGGANMGGGSWGGADALSLQPPANLGPESNKHGATHQCPHCARAFSKKSNMDRHVMVVHLKIKKYQCLACDKRYGQRQELEAHYRWHRQQQSKVAP